MSDFSHDFVVIELVADFAVVAGHGHYVVHGNDGIGVVLIRRRHGNFEFIRHDFQNGPTNEHLAREPNQSVYLYLRNGCKGVQNLLRMLQLGFLSILLILK